MARACPCRSLGRVWPVSGIGDTVKIAHISDFHLVASGKTLGIAPMAENLAKVVAHINGLKPDLVVVTGDITHNARVAEARRAAGILAKLEAPFYLTPGNHDDRTVLREVFGKGAMPASETRHLSYVVNTPSYKIIALDSTDPDADNGRICDARAAWLKAALGHDPRPTLIFMHHPPVKCAVEETDNPPLIGVDRFAEIVARHPEIERIMCGHIHIMAQAMLKGVPISTAPSIGMRLAWTPARLTASRFFVSPPAYLWHMHNEDGALITHEFTLDIPTGPHEFA